MKEYLASPPPLEGGGRGGVMTFKFVRKKNEKLWNNLTKRLKDFKIEAGWFENTKYDDGTPVGYIAAIQNYGVRISVTDKQRNYLHYLGIHLKQSTGEIVIPPRPFMDNAKARVEGSEGHQVMFQELIRVFEGNQTLEQACNRLAEWLQGVIQEEIIKLNQPALSSATIEIRNNKYLTKSKNTAQKPLQSSGIMLATVQNKVTFGEGK